MANSARLLRQDELWRSASKFQVKDDISLHYSKPKSFIQRSLIAGNLAEISGQRSSGKTSLCLDMLAQATARGEVCAVVDLQHSFDPASAQAAGVALEQIVWVRCQRDAQHTMRAADLLLHAGGFGVVLLDLCEAPLKVLNRIPLSYWYRLRRAVEHTSTILLVCTECSEVKCSVFNKIALKRKAEHWVGQAPFLRLQGWETAAISTKALTLSPEHIYISAVA